MSHRAAAAGGRSLSLAFAVAWLAYFVALQWSVVRFKVPIVVILTTCAVLLALWQWHRARVELSPPAVVLMLVGSALATLVVPLFSYLEGPGLVVATTLLVAAPVVLAVLLAAATPGRARTAVGVALGVFVAVGAVAIRTDPAPEIDVWVTLQQASDALRSGVSFYEVTWEGSPGVADAFTYLPWTAVLLAPGRWLAGDVRWALILWTVVAAIGVWALAAGRDGGARSGGRPGRGAGADGDRGSGGPGAATVDQGADPAHPVTWGPGPAWRAAAAICLLLFAPGTLTQVDQAWSEPLLLAGLVWWAVLVDRDRAWWAVLPLALACASKQHLALLLPVLLLWRPFGVRRTLATGALTGLLIAPWFLAGPADFLHDTVTLLISFHAILFANTLYLLALNVFGIALPFWVTGVVVLGCLGLVMRAVHRRQPGVGELVRWLALVLLVANLVNKQAFYNQYWLVGALVVVSLVVPSRPVSSRAAPAIPAPGVVRPQA